MKYKCQKCNHTWNPRKKQKPITCPKCKSAYWDTPSFKLSKEFIERTKDKMIVLHDAIIKKSGGEMGIRDEGGLHNSTYRILNDVVKNFKEPLKSGAFIFEDIAKRHNFVDGNKRTAYCFSKVVLISIGYHFKPNYSTALPFILQIADDKNPKTFEEIHDWIKDNVEKIKTKKIDSYLKELYYDITHAKNEGEKNDK